MEKHHRNRGRTAITIMLIVGILVPTALFAMPPGPLDPPEESGGGGIREVAVGDPDDGSSGLPRRADEQFTTIVRLILRQYLTENIDSRVINWRAFFVNRTLPRVGQRLQ